MLAKHITFAVLLAGAAAAPPTVNAGPCALPLFAKPMDPTAKKNKPLNGGAPDLLLSIGVVQS